MNKSVQQFHIFYEIAMSIGNSQDIRKMLKQALLTYLRKLNCLAGMVYKLNKISSEEYLFEELFSIPYTLNIKEFYKEIGQKLSGVFSEKKLSDLCKEAPYFEKTYNENYYYIFKLGDFGLLLLIKPKPFEPEIIRLLDEVNRKLTHACEACINNEKIIESEKKYRELSEMLPEMICETDLKGNITYANQYAFEKMEYKAEDLDKGFHVMDLVAPIDQKRFFNNFRKALKSDNRTPNEYTVVTKSEKKRSVILHTSRIRQSDEVKGIRGVMIDITERKENENKIKTLSESTFEAIFFSKDGVCINQNYTAAKMFGYSLEEAIGKPGTDWIHPDYRELVAKKMRDGIDSPYEAVATRKDGTTFPCEIQGKVSCINDEQIRITALRNISARKDAETAKKESEEKYKILTQSSLDIIFTIDKVGIINFMSESVISFLGYEPKDVIGTSFVKYVPKKEIPGYLKNLKEIFRENEIKNFETQIYHQNGSLLNVEINGKLVKQNNKLLGIGSIRDITQRKKTEKALLESEANLKQYTERFELALLGSDAGLWDWNIKTGHMYFSERWCEMLEYKQDEIEPNVSAWEKRIHPDDAEMVHKALKDHLDGKTSLYITEHRVKTKSGNWIWILDSGKVISRSKSGKALRTVGTHIDISEKKENVFQLQQNYIQQELLSEIALGLNNLEGFDEKLNSVLTKIGDHTDVSRVYIFEDDEGGESTSNTFEWCNKEIAGQKDELQGIPYEIIPSWKKFLLNDGRVYSENIKELPQDLIDILEPQEIKSIVVFPLFVNGNFFGFIGFDECVRNKHWTKSELELLRTVSGIIANTYERNKSEQLLKNSEEKYSNIVNNANDGIYLRDLDGKIIFANKKFAEIHGYTVDETIGRKSWEFLHPESLEKITATKEFDRVQDGFQTQREEIGLTKSGDEVYLDIRTAPLIIQGEISGIFGIVRNISERKEYERQLEEERDKAYQANKAKSEFLANMSHEIRTPMNAILGFSDALYHKLDTTSHKKMLKSILSSGKLLLSLLNDILDLSKIEAGKLEISPQPVDFKSIIEEIKLLFTEKAKKKGLEINLQIAPEFPDVISLDEMRIKQVIFNLLGNAIKFTPRGYVNIRAKYISMSDGKGDLIIEVEDSGIGIAELQKEKIFVAFIQQSGQSNRMYEGVGLGLAISKRLIEKMGGTIDVESTINKGSVFSVKIPDVETSYVEIRENKSIANIKNVVFNNAIVLVVDDVNTNIETIENLLIPVGLSVTSAENGEIALELLNHTIPDLILLDLRMPGIDGFEVAKKIKENPKTAKTPVIAFTASVFSSDRIEQSGNFDGFLFKPVSRDELLSTLSKYLDHRFRDQTELIKQDQLDPGVIDAEIINQLPELIHELKSKMLPQWESIKDHLVLYKIEEFASELNKLAHKSQLEFLLSYANKLLEDLDLVDLEALNETIKDFPGIIRQIESLVK